MRIWAPVSLSLAIPEEEEEEEEEEEGSCLSRRYSIVNDRTWQMSARKRSRISGWRSDNR